MGVISVGTSVWSDTRMTNRHVPRIESHATPRPTARVARRAPSELPTLIDIEKTAEHLGVSVRHVRRLVAERRIPYVKVGFLVRFDPTELGEWIDEHRRRSAG